MSTVRPEDKLVSMEEFQGGQINKSDEAQAKMKQLLDNIRTIGKTFFDVERNRAEVFAKVKKIEYDEYVKAGFTKAEALELIKK